MSGFKITELDDTWLMVEKFNIVKEATSVLMQMREPRSTKGALGKVIREWEEETTIDKEVMTGFIAVITKKQHELMVYNYSLGNCGVYEKAYIRYSNTCKQGVGWYGQPGQTARKLVRSGVPCPKQLDTLIQNIMNEV